MRKEAEKKKGSKERFGTKKTQKKVQEEEAYYYDPQYPCNKKPNYEHDQHDMGVHSNILHTGIPPLE